MLSDPSIDRPNITARTQDKVKELIGIKESDTGLSLPSQWDLVSDKQMMQVRMDVVGGIVIPSPLSVCLRLCEWFRLVQVVFQRAFL